VLDSTVLASLVMDVVKEMGFAFALVKAMSAVELVGVADRAVEREVNRPLLSEVVNTGTEMLTAPVGPTPLVEFPRV
jgi:hypothetical protein